MRNKSFPIAFALVAILMQVHICQAGEHKASKSVRKLAITVDTKKSGLMGSMLMVNGKVLSKTTKETIRYSPKIYMEFIDNTKGKTIRTVESVFTFDKLKDKDTFKVEPGKTGPFFSVMSGDRKYTFSGKGVVYIYATIEGASGVENRISNLIRLSVDFDKQSIKFLDDQP